MARNKNLKPCPFCNKQVNLRAIWETVGGGLVGEEDKITGWEIRCPRCNVFMLGRMEWGQLENSWNTRYDTDKPSN